MAELFYSHIIREFSIWTWLFYTEGSARPTLLTKRVPFDYIMC